MILEQMPVIFFRGRVVFDLVLLLVDLVFGCSSQHLWRDGHSAITMLSKIKAIYF